MNKVIISGVLAKDPDIRNVGESLVANFTVAVRRGYRNKEGKYLNDYINCVVWNKTAEYMQKFAQQGIKCNVIGSMENRSYDDKNGQKRYITEVRAESVEMFGPSNAPQESAPAQTPEPAPSPYPYTVPAGFSEVSGEGLPF